MLSSNPGLATTVIALARSDVKAMLTEIGGADPTLLALSAAAAVCMFAAQRDKCSYPAKLAIEVLLARMLESECPLMSEAAQNALAMVLRCNQLQSA